MALVERFTAREASRTAVHQKVEGAFMVFERDGETFLQLDTYGSPGRKIPGKVSQLLQLGRGARAQLLELLSSIKE